MSTPASIDVFSTGDDASKTFRIARVDPLTFAGYVLRLVAALRVDSYEGLMADIQTSIEQDAAPIDTIMHVLQGCDPLAVHALIKDLLTHVTISPDPKHPTAWRPLMGDDIVELKTLGNILTMIFQMHFSAGK